MREIMMRLRVLLAVLWTIVILVLCWTPQAMLSVNEGPESLAQELLLDKLIHAGIFTVFSVLWLRTRPAGKTRFLSVLLAGTALAAITETVQNLPIINREGEFQDALADFAGVLFGFPLFKWIEQKLREWRAFTESQESNTR
jgi:VanZ family protein